MYMYLPSIDTIAKKAKAAIQQFQKNFEVYTCEDFNESKKYLDQLLQLESDNAEYNKQSNLLEKILQKYKAAKYTLDKIDIDDAISEYTNLLTDDELSNISIFYSGLATAYKKKDRSYSYSDSLNFKYLDLVLTEVKNRNNNQIFNKLVKNINQFIKQIIIGLYNLKTTYKDCSKITCKVDSIIITLIDFKDESQEFTSNIKKNKRLRVMSE